MKKKLFPGREHEIRATVHALQYLVLEFHVKRRSHSPVPAPAGDPNGNVRVLHCVAGANIPLVTHPMDSARHAMCIAWILLNDLSGNVHELAVRETGPFPHRNGPVALVLLFASFFATALARQRFFYAFSFTGFQVERVTFYFLDYVLGLYLTLEPAKCVLEGFPLL